MDELLPALMEQLRCERVGLDALVDAYTASLAAAGLSAGYPNDSVARSFFVNIGVPAWEAMLTKKLRATESFG
ncbi:MAG: hypothetical protein LC798_22020 [Chloroflexi bacterium]|nr:hypothetical protein [Chloroflexota bacterium]